MPESSEFRQAFRLLGEYLEFAGQPLRIVIVGGTALNLLGLIDRTTADADVIAFEEDGELVSPTVLPIALTEGIAEVASSLNLPQDWLNTQPAMQLQFGLPTGFSERITWQEFGALSVGIASRVDLICLKLFAAVDHWPTRGVHFQDLRALDPSSDELAWAAGWVETQDASPEFPRLVAAVQAALSNHVRG